MVVVDVRSCVCTGPFPPLSPNIDDEDDEDGLILKLALGTEEEGVTVGVEEQLEDGAGLSAVVCLAAGVVNVAVDTV